MAKRDSVSLEKITLDIKPEEGVTITSCTAYRVGRIVFLYINVSFSKELTADSVAKIGNIGRYPLTRGIGSGNYGTFWLGLSGDLMIRASAYKESANATIYAQFVFLL